jgi:alkylation response protein AidB-like acyl-CoA dehydrogenase
MPAGASPLECFVMFDAATLSPQPALGGTFVSATLEEVRTITQRDLSRLVRSIDLEGLYPEEIMRALGRAGAYGAHIPGIPSGAPDLKTAVEAMSLVSEYCLSTSFCAWCQNALAWYIFTSDNSALQSTLGMKVAGGETLGGTGLSNPMKSLFGIEKMRVRGTRVAGGYAVKGALPWVSNLGPDHFFGGIFEVDENPAHRVMAVIDCAGPGVTIRANDHFVALEGTRTYGVQFRDAFIPDEMILADPVDAYIERIRAGFILLQSGMAFGLIRNCIALMQEVRPSLAHVNKYLEKQPEHFEAELEAMEAEVWELCKTPFDPSPAYFRRVVAARLAAGEAAVQAAHNAMLHCGARGYVSNGAAQRRLREAYFVAIVTPATKQLRKMLAEMAN